MKFDKLVKEMMSESFRSRPGRGPGMGYGSNPEDDADLRRAFGRTSDASNNLSWKEKEQTVGEGETWDITDTNTGKIVHSAAAKEDALSWARSQPKGQHFSIRRVRQS